MHNKVHNNLTESQDRIFNAIRENPYITRKELIESLNLSDSAVAKGIAKLKELGLIKRIGSNKVGHWEIINNSFTKKSKEVDKKNGIFV